MICSFPNVAKPPHLNQRLGVFCFYHPNKELSRFWAEKITRVEVSFTRVGTAWKRVYK